MGLVVQKFGGSSVATNDRIRSAAKRAVQVKLAGNDVVVVVSARGQTTDELYELAYEITSSPSKRELDMLVSTGEQVSIALMAMAIQALGHKAVSFVASQINLLTDSFHTKATIRSIDQKKIRQALSDGHIVVVAGFQGVDSFGNITTLGRGGSDTTAVAIAAVLGADLCEIYTDVDGVYTADPRIVPDARKIDRISYDEMLELASLGAGVLHGRSVEFAKKFDVPLVVRSSFSNDPGTVVTKEVRAMEDVVVRGAAVAQDEAKITLRGVPDRPGIAARILRAVAAKNINVDMIVQNASADGLADFSFTVPKTDLEEALALTATLKDEIGLKEVESNSRISKLSVVGVGMRSHAGVAERMFSALAAEKINIQMISTSEIKISCVIDEASGRRALAAVHRAFGLGKHSKVRRGSSKKSRESRVESREWKKKT